MAAPFAEDLDATLAEAWRLLGDGVADRRAPAHTPSLATVGLDGRPRLRVVVLRAVEPEARRLRIHTDARSDKAAEILADPRVALLVYDAPAKLQLRIEGRAALHRDDAIADAAWAASRPMSRACYGTLPPSGSAIEAAGAFVLPSDEVALAAGRAHFAALSVMVETVETLHLAHGGHRRARFDLVEGRAGWLVP